MFPKGLVHGFGQMCFKTIKHKKLKKSIHGTSEKFEIFHLFILGKIGKGKCVWRYSRKEKGVFRL